MGNCWVKEAVMLSSIYASFNKKHLVFLQRFD